AIQSSEVRRPDIGHLRSFDVQSFKPAEMPDGNEFRIRGNASPRPSGAGEPTGSDVDPGDVPEVVDPDTIHQPSRPPGRAVGGVRAVLELPIVPDSSPRSLDRRHGIALDTGLAHDPA